MKILFLASEADPFVKVGGLGDVAGSLPYALRALGHDTRLVLPFHSNLNTSGLNMHRETVFTVPRNGSDEPVQVSHTEINGLPIYLISGEPISKTASVYSPIPHVDGEKYTFFSMAALELARRLEWAPDILHANDWHTAPAVYAMYLKKQNGDPLFAKTKSVLSIHNLGFMGAGSSEQLAAYGLPPVTDEALPAWARHMPLPLGLWAADELVAVSPTYAEEILTPDFGCDLDGFLRTRSATVTGIVNGIDYSLWDPSADDSITAKFNADHLDARAANKAALQKRFGLAIDPSIPLLAMVTRFDPQKGVDIALEALRHVNDLPWQAIFLGTGHANLEASARRLEADLPDRVCAVLRFDARLSREIYAGADIFLMPSRYEPCGLAQMIAMRYGALPLARAVGGLRDTIVHNQTGFLFAGASPHALSVSLRSALKKFPNAKTWRAMQRRAMAQDFSWARSAGQYVELFEALIK